MMFVLSFLFKWSDWQKQRWWKKNLASIYKIAGASIFFSKKEMSLAVYPHISNFMGDKLHQNLDPDDAIHQGMLRNWLWQE